LPVDAPAPCRPWQKLEQRPTEVEHIAAIEDRPVHNTYTLSNDIEYIPPKARTNQHSPKSFDG
jgi:hypothetical protein